MSKTLLTVEHLKAGEMVGHGFGFYGHEIRTVEAWSHVADPASTVASIDRFAVDIANELGWTAAQLHEWADSKPGRWTGDSMYRLTNVGALKVLCDAMKSYEFETL